jgi:hypothetical protein
VSDKLARATGLDAYFASRTPHIAESFLAAIGPRARRLIAAFIRPWISGFQERLRR